MKTFLLFFVLFSASSFAAKLKVMTFNTMCDLCGDRDHYERFKKRLGHIADTVKRHEPDLISFQEFRTARQLKRLNKALAKKYFILYSNGLILNYADPALFIRKDRFEVLSHHAYWLGPRRGRFSFGWRFAIPRKLRWTKLKDKQTGQEFFFVGSHFDNHGENKENSANLINKLFKDAEVPIIFAADTNLKTSHNGYQVLTSMILEDTYYKVASPVFWGNTQYTPDDACNKKKALTFPECRIDHVMLSHNSPWAVTEWGVDVFRYGPKNFFTSDHRAVVVTLESN